MIDTIRNLVKIELALIAIIIVAMFFTEALLPVDLQEYLAVDAEAAPPTVELIALIFLLVVGLVNLVSMIGLLAIKAWARKAYIYSTILIFPVCFFIGPHVDHAVDYTLDQVSVLIQGMILSLLVYSGSYQEAALNKAFKNDADKAGKTGLRS